MTETGIGEGAVLVSRGRTLIALTACLMLMWSISPRLEQQRGFDPSAPARTGQPKPGVQVTTITATAVIRGRVTSAANGAPIRAAEVRVRSDDGRDSRLATADDDGRFEIRDLTPGAWMVRASKAGFVSQQFGQSHPLDAATPVALTNGQRFNADITLLRGGAIGGRVVDEGGDPMSGVQVQVLRSRIMRGRPQLTPSGAGDTTDDRGAFRVYGLVPGTYYVAAILRAPEDMARGAMANVTVYFPGTRSVREAQRVTLGPGEDQSAISISARRPSSGGVQVSGVVFSSRGAPAAGASIHLYNADDLSMGAPSKGIFVNADPAGRFTALTVVAGSYLVDATHNGIGGLERALVPIEVGNTDLAGVAIATTPAVTLSGTAVAETGSTLPQNLSVRIAAQSVDGSPGSEMTGMQFEGTRFVLQGLTGRLVLGISVSQEGWTVKSLEINGQDVTDGVVDFSSQPSAASARLVLTNRGGEVSGTVTARGLPRRASVVVFPADAAKWTYPSRLVRMGKADAEGKFRISGLMAENRYRAVAVSFLEEDEFQDIEFLERINKAATDFSLRENEKKTIDLTIVQR